MRVIVLDSEGYSFAGWNKPGLISRRSGPCRRFMRLTAIFLEAQPEGLPNERNGLEASLQPWLGPARTYRKR